ncbi:uncharacterized protein [Palaemon carinicauda]|uniref:uncharacterized protein n=1 Tax=Palaemon carinicauda TaxID=392227 RepID=UPI0035B69319
MASLHKHTISFALMAILGLSLVLETNSELVVEVRPAGAYMDAIHDQLTVVDVMGNSRGKRSPGQAESSFYGKNTGMKGGFRAESETGASGNRKKGHTALSGKFSGHGRISGGTHTSVDK